MQVVLGIIVGVIIAFTYIYFFGDDNTYIDEAEARNVKLARQLKEALDENKELKELRKQAVHNNTIILERNRILENTIKEIETEMKKQQFGSVTNLQNKINHILMTVKSK